MVPTKAVYVVQMSPVTTMAAGRLSVVTEMQVTTYSVINVKINDYAYRYLHTKY